MAQRPMRAAAAGLVLATVGLWAPPAWAHKPVSACAKKAKHAHARRTRCASAFAGAPAVRYAAKSYGYGAGPAVANGPVIDLRGALPAARLPTARLTAFKADAAADPPVFLEERPAGTGGGDEPSSAQDYSQDGVASWYGAGFDGRPTASGASEPATGFVVQVGAYAQPDNAERARARAAAAGAASVEPAEVGGAQLFRVRLGPWASREAAEAARATALALGFDGARVMSAN
jgi:rare lipoprotein A